MAALRWILLLVGLVFLLGLAAWELRRTRQAGRRLGRSSASEEPTLGTLPEELSAATVTIPVAPAGSRGTPPRSTGPTVLSDPAVIVLAPTRTLAAAPSRALDPEPPEALQAPEPPQLEPAAAAASPGSAQDEAGHDNESEDAPAHGAAGPGLAELGSGITLRVDWPPEAERHIMALRIVAPSAEKLSGRAVRQALDACGFVHGRYRIYHQPCADGRALLSCASLSKPGNFDPITLDFQRLNGLSVFTVLPGPLPPPLALERLLETARELSQRLHAVLQDEQGYALDTMRLQTLKSAALDLSRQAAGAAVSRGPAA